MNQIIKAAPMTTQDKVDFAPEMAMRDHAQELVDHPNACNAHVTAFINYLVLKPQNYSDYLDSKISL